MSFIEFLRRRLGNGNWVVAKRRTPRLVERYANILTPRQFSKLKYEYTKLTGRQPY